MMGLFSKTYTSLEDVTSAGPMDHIMSTTLSYMEDKIQKDKVSLKDASYVYPTNRWRKPRKSKYKYEVNISEKLHERWFDIQREEGSFGYDIKQFKEIGDWLKDNTEHDWFIVFFDPEPEYGVGDSLRANMNRVFFINPDDAAAFKLYYT